MYLIPDEIEAHLRETHIETDEGWWEGILQTVYRSDWKLVQVKCETLPDFGSFSCYESKVAEYAELDTAAPVAVVTEDGVVLDGCHRMKAAVRRGVDTFPAYVPAGAEDDEPWIVQE